MTADLSERDDLISRVAEKIKCWGMTTPAIMFLEANKPFSFIAAQVFWVVEPLLDLFIGAGRWREYGLLFEDRASVERLLECLEADE